MDLIIRQEIISDHPLVFDLITRAFASEEMSDHKENQLKNALESQFRLVNVGIDEYTILDETDDWPRELFRRSEKNELIIWSEGDSAHRSTYLDILLEHEAEEQATPAIMIFNKT